MAIDIRIYLVIIISETVSNYIMEKLYLLLKDDFYYINDTAPSIN